MKKNDKTNLPYETETRRLPLPGVRRTTRYQAIDERGKEMHYVTSKRHSIGIQWNESIPGMHAWLHLL